jgi:hypothetical protein
MDGGPHRTIAKSIRAMTRQRLRSNMSMHSGWSQDGQDSGVAEL